MLCRVTNGGGRLVVVDTNVLLYYMDVLEYFRKSDGDNNHNEAIHSIASAVVISQTALEECRNRSLFMYHRVTDLIHSSSTGG
eukprot:CCRYP_007133-RA/>CCRYP_007133-RA protein AED:0.53 eAED:0.53 QI:0/-1/0/1/-1/1/1/0/82